MNKKKILIALTAAALLVTLTIGGTLAYFTDSDERENVVTMGNVDIVLKETDEKTRDDGTIGLDYDHILPNQEIKKDPYVEIVNDSQDAWVRVKLTIADATGSARNMTEEEKTALTEAINAGVGLEKADCLWVYNATDNYYYCKKPFSLTAGTAGKEDFTKKEFLFEKFNIPEEWNNDQAKLKFKIELIAEAIQYDSFVTDVSAFGTTGWVDSKGAAITAEEYKAPTTP